MARVLDFTCSDSSISLSVRATRNGPERVLMDSFISATLSKVRRHPWHYALFCEPQIDTGFPDIVLARYNPAVFDDWNQERNRVTIQDLKLLHHLNCTQGGDAEMIEAQLGISSKPLLRSLERLMSAGLVRWHGKKWVPRSVRNTFAISSLIAIEAKMNDWTSAFCQADLNRWFASETYILSPIAKPRQHIVHKSERTGIGIYSMPSNARTAKIIQAKRGCIPASFASWQFNEWIGKRLTAIGEQ